MDINTRKGFPPPNKSNLYRLLKRFRSILEHNQLSIRTSHSNNEATLLKVCEKLCHRKKLCVRLLKLSGLCVMPEVMQTLHRYRHLRVYSYREYMKADGSIKQNGGVLNIAFIPPFVISDDAEEQVSIDKNSRLRAGLWKEASRFDWDSRSRILQLLFIMAAFSATLSGWIGSSECYSPKSAIEIWKRFSDPSFCTVAMPLEEASSPQDIRQGWETAVKVIKTNVAELYHDKEKPIPPRLRRWGRQTEFAVRITDVQERTVIWFAQLVSEMCVMTHDRLAQQSTVLKNFLKPLAVQAEASFQALLEREVGIALDQVNWKGVFSEQRALELLSRCQHSIRVLKQVPDDSSESAVPHSDRDEDENMEEGRTSEPKSGENHEYKHGERQEVLSPISPDVDVTHARKLNRTDELSLRLGGISGRKEVDASTKTEDVHQLAPGNIMEESDTDASSPVFIRPPSQSNERGEKQDSGCTSKQYETSIDPGARDQTMSSKHNSIAGQKDAENCLKDQNRENEHSDDRRLINSHGNYTGAQLPQQGQNDWQSRGIQKRFGRYVGTNGESHSIEKRRASEVGLPKKKARVQVKHSTDSVEQHGVAMAKDIAQGRCTPPCDSELIQEVENAPNRSKSAVDSISHPSGLEGEYSVSDNRRYGKKQFISSICQDGGPDQRQTAQAGTVSESHRQRIADRIAIQVKREVLLRRQRSDMVERNGRHMVVPPKKRPKYLEPCL
ncbi:unnamed protein product [Agarophyton chilense]|eukprot:gb/GEZJ01000889.1/.p1 GENE.gb/GEZJ01000889.1/~~gb/GEZJ01000889.1/.p1  ORF type:complete len:727 (-),score=97.26 gb/GEZJ01000889.1/:4826-7006(-)